MASYRPKKKVDDQGTTVDLPLDAETLNGKTADDFQEKLTFDTVPTAGSMNPVTSDGIKSALEDHYPSRATANTLGLIKIGFTQDARFYPVQLDVNDRAYVHVPWIDTRSAVTKAQETADRAADAADRAAAAAETNRQSISYLETNKATKGAVITTASVSGKDITFTRGDGTTFTLTTQDTNTEYFAATADKAGLIRTGFTETGKNYAVKLNATGQAYVHVPWSDTNTTYDLATSSSNGLMSMSDKKALDGMKGQTYCHEVGITSLNNIKGNGVTYAFTTAGNTANTPCNWGTVTNFEDALGNRYQFAYNWNTTTNLYYRSYYNGTWTDWILLTDNALALANNALTQLTNGVNKIINDAEVVSRNNGDSNDGGHIYFKKPDGSYTAIGAYGGFRAYWFDGGYRAFGVYTDGSITVDGNFGAKKILDAYGHINMSYRNVWGGRSWSISIDLPNGQYVAFTDSGYAIHFTISGDPKSGSGCYSVPIMNINDAKLVCITYANGIIYCEIINVSQGFTDRRQEDIIGIYLGITEQTA